MKDQNLFDNLAAALGHKQRVIDSRGNYIHTVRVPYEVSHSNWWSGGILGRTKTAYQDEVRFNHVGFYQDVALADQCISQCQAAIDAKLSEYRRQLALSITSRAAEATKIAQLKSDIHYLRQQTKTTEININELKAKTDQERSKVKCLAAEITSVEQTKASLPVQIDKTKVQIVETQASAAIAGEEIKTLRELVSAEHRALFDLLSSASPSQRAAMYASMFCVSGKEVVLDMIEAIGFDANYLAYLSIEKDNGELLEVALKHRANCTGYMVGDKTLLQKAILESKEGLAEKILAASEQLEVTLLHATSQTDIVTIDRIVQHDPDCLKKAIHGYTLLQCAISCNNLLVVQHILQMDPNTVNSKTSQGESCFKVAVRNSLTSHSNDITKLVADHVDIKEELRDLIDSQDLMLFEAVLRACPVSDQVITELADHSIKVGAISIASSIIDNYPALSLSGIYQKALSNSNYQMLRHLTELDDKLHELLPENPEVLEEFQSYLVGSAPSDTIDS